MLQLPGSKLQRQTEAVRFGFHTVRTPGANAVDTKMALILSNSESSFSAPRTKKIWLQRARPARALLVKELQALVWEPRPSALELERLLNAMVAYEDKDLGGQAQQHPSVIDELRVVRHVIKSNEGKVNKAITTASAAIKSIRERSTSGGRRTINICGVSEAAAVAITSPATASKKAPKPNAFAGAAPGCRMLASRGTSIFWLVQHPRALGCFSCDSQQQFTNPVGRCR